MERISGGMVEHLEKLSQQVPEMLNRPFQFSQKQDKIRWNELEELDIDELQKTTNLHTLERHLSSATYAKLQKEDLDRIGDPAVTKLFKLSQLSMEYMQFTQNTLENLIEGIDIKYRKSYQKCKSAETKVVDNQIEINKLRNEIEVKKGSIKAYQMHMKEKALRRKNRIALLKKERLRCPDCDIGFLTQKKLDWHFETIHTEDVEFMRRTAKEYNEKLQEEDMEEREDIKDLVIKAQEKIGNVMVRETNNLKNDMVESKRNREEELFVIKSQCENEIRKREEEKQIANELYEHNTQRLQETTNGIMTNFQSKLDEMYTRIEKQLEKDAREEKEREDNVRNKEQELYKTIEKRNNQITELRNSQDDIMSKLNINSKVDPNDTFSRLEELKNTIANPPENTKELYELEQKKNQEIELTLMEGEEYRTRQIAMNEQHIKDLKDYQHNLQKAKQEANERKPTQSQIQASEQKSIKLENTVSSKERYLIF